MIPIDILDYLSQKGVRLTPQQQQGLSLSEDPLLLLAVPGSGKTTVLVSRVAAQLLSGIPSSRLLNLTFSRESAKDMASRFAALFPELPPPRFSTIHSLCYSVLRAYADAAGRVVGVRARRVFGKEYTGDYARWKHRVRAVRRAALDAYHASYRPEVAASLRL